jgi:hypothetical protein
MNRIVWDHVRRWWWVWLAVNGYVIYGVLVVATGKDRTDWTRTFMPLALFLGGAQLSADLGRGDIPRLLRTLPVTAREVGRAWWWASVGLPALVSGVVTAVTLGVAVLVSRVPVSVPGGVCYWLTNALWFGPWFLVAVFSPRGADKGWKNGRQRMGVARCLFTVVFMLGMMVILMFFYRLVPPYSVRWDIFLVVAAGMSVASWFRAEAFAAETLGAVKTNTETARATAESLEVLDQFVDRHVRPLTGGQHLARSAEGYGGLRLLFESIYLPMISLGAFMVMLMGVMLCWGVRRSGYDADFMGVFFSFMCLLVWLPFIVVLPRILSQMRWLRTLPISSTQLAGVVICAPVAATLTLLGLDELIMVLIRSGAGYVPLAPLYWGCLVELTLPMVLVPLVVWRGADAVVLVTVVGLMLVLCVANWPTQTVTLSPGENAGVALLVVLGSFALTKGLLERGSRVYRGQTP